MKNKAIKVIISIILVVSYFLFPKYGFTFYGDLCNHFLYPFSHANIWHLAGNILCLWMLSCNPYILITYLCAVLCSFLPCPQLSIMELRVIMDEPTMGFSGILFAMVGVSWGMTRRFKDMLLRNKWFLIVTVFIPHMNFMIHLYCLLLGYTTGAGIYKFNHPHTLKLINLCAKKSRISLMKTTTEDRKSMDHTTSLQV